MIQIDVSFSGPGGVPRYDAIRQRLQDLSPAGPAVLDAMRRGEGSVADQFASQAEETMGGARSWVRTKDFGTRKAGRTLHDTGALEAAWTGGPGSRSIVTRDTFGIGVDAGMFPQARVFQSKTPTTVRAKKMGARGRYAMFWRLLFDYGVKVSKKKLEQGFVIQPRRVGIGRRMAARVRAAIRDYVIHGRAAGARKAA